MRRGSTDMTAAATRRSTVYAPPPWSATPVSTSTWPPSASRTMTDVAPAPMWRTPSATPRLRPGRQRLVPVRLALQRIEHLDRARTNARVRR